MTLEHTGNPFIEFTKESREIPEGELPERVKKYGQDLLKARGGDAGVELQWFTHSAVNRKEYPTAAVSPHGLTVVANGTNGPVKATYIPFGDLDEASRKELNTLHNQL